MTDDLSTRRCPECHGAGHHAGGVRCPLCRGVGIVPKLNTKDAIAASLRSARSKREEIAAIVEATDQTDRLRLAEAIIHQAEGVAKNGGDPTNILRSYAYFGESSRRPTQGGGTSDA